MVAFELLTHIFQHPWRDIFYASWRKYPCSDRPDVLSVELLKKRFDADTGILYTTRLLTLKTCMPGWMERITGGGSSNAYFIEEAVIDPKNNKMTLYGRNISFNQVLLSEETCTYTPHPDQPNEWTHFKQEAKITAFPYGVSRQVENWCVSLFRQNASKGRSIMENAISRVKQEAEEGLNALDEMGSRIKQEAEDTMNAVVGGIADTFKDGQTATRGLLDALDLPDAQPAIQAKTLL